MAVYRRVLLKLSGEALAGGDGYGINPAALETIAGEVIDAVESGVQVALVIGGGNIFRGLAAAAEGMDRVTGDSIGMLATVINGLAFGEILERKGRTVRHMSALPVREVVEQFDRAGADAALSAGDIVIFSGGTGNPYFSTDTAASLRAAQIHADAILKGTKVDGVYEGDPVQDSSVRRFDEITFGEVLERGLRVMDATAVAMCRDNRIPIVVFNLTAPGTLARVLDGESLGTIVKEDENG